MGRYKLANEVWSIEQDGSAISITEPNGEWRLEEMKSLAMATTRFNVLVNQKLRAGWKLQPPEAVPPPLPPVRDARNAELDAAVIREPRSRELRMVYGDWLMQQGDLRGEHIALTAAGDFTALDKFERRNIDYLLGGCSDGVLAWGFVDAVRAGFGTDLEQRFACTSARFATRLLTIGATDPQLRHLILAIGKATPSTVIEMRLGGGARTSDLEPVAAVFARIRKLDLDITVHPDASVPALPNLELLELGEHVRFWQPALYQRTDLTSLKQLSLHCTLDAASIDRLVQAPLLANLERLVLPTLTDNIAAHTLLAHARALRVPVIAIPQAPTDELFRALQRQFPGRVEELANRRSQINVDRW